MTVRPLAVLTRVTWEPGARAMTAVPAASAVARTVSGAITTWVGCHRQQAVDGRVAQIVPDRIAGLLDIAGKPGKTKRAARHAGA